MVMRPSIVCPIDFSAASRGALRYAAAIAEHFYATLTLVAVNDRFVSHTADIRFGERWLERRAEQELENFVKHAFPGRTPQMPELKTMVSTGTPAVEIRAAAAQTHADLIVMSTHGTSGIRKRIFGSTVERVLRETTVPVIVTPSHDPGPESLEDWRESVKMLLVPVDLSYYSERQVHIASGLGEALGAVIMLAHVLEPIQRRVVAEEFTERADSLRRDMAIARLEELARMLPPEVKPVTALVTGDPAKEIARLAKEYSAGAVVMGLHSSLNDGPRMGTVTYRLLCEAPVLVVAWPPSRLEHRLRFGHGVREAAAASAR